MLLIFLPMGRHKAVSVSPLKIPRTSRHTDKLGQGVRVFSGKTVSFLDFFTGHREGSLTGVWALLLDSATSGKPYEGEMKALL